MDVKKLLTYFSGIDNKLSMVKSSFEALKQVEIDNLKKLENKSFERNSFIVKQISERRGKLTQIYETAKNDETLALIDEIKTSSASIVEWLRKVSNITDPAEVAKLFSTAKSATDTHQNFIDTFKKFSEKIGELNSLIGNSTKVDDILIERSSLLSNSYEMVANSIDNANKAVCKNGTFKNSYISVLNENFGVIFNSAREISFQEQMAYVKKVDILNEYVNKYVFPLVGPSLPTDRTQEFIQNFFRKLFVLVNNSKISKVEQVKNLVDKACMDNDIYRNSSKFFKKGVKFDLPGPPNKLGEIALGGPTFYTNFVFNGVVPINVVQGESNKEFLLSDLKPLP